MGDDDYLVSKHSISIVHEIIQSDTEDLSFVPVKLDAAHNLKNVYKQCVGSGKFGYHEMLGCFPTPIMRKEFGSCT